MTENHDPIETTDFTNPRGERVSRLAAVKLVLRDFIERRKSDRLGLIVFGDQPYLQAPFTRDHEVVATLLGETATKMAGPQTAMGDAIGLAVLMMLEQRCRWRWREVIAPHLLKHLVRHPLRRAWTRPASFTLPVFIVTILSLSGPTWQRQETPFVQDEAPLVVALDLSQSMDAVDVAPTRLERAQQKIRDLLALRPRARTGLIAYAGSSHMVLPLTDDSKVIETYVISLETELMPLAGKDPVNALKLAGKLLAKETAAGTILFVTDGIVERDC
ncbi:MAG: VWA domain-containing protein [Planctomycetota bacterium]